jgi:hypothetical protein
MKRALIALLATAVLLGGCSAFGNKLGAHSISVFTLRTGECLNPPMAIKAQLSTVSVISCHAAHTQEVFALVKDQGPMNYPGAQSLETIANGKCLQYFQPYVGVAYQHSSLFYTYLLPSVRSWESGDRTIACIITTTGRKLTTSVKGSKL